VVVLSGGTGGAKLARGMADLPDAELTVVANTGDDIEIYGAYVSPDPDLVSFWLAGQIDPRGWGLAGDSFKVMDGLRASGRQVEFNLGDHDLAIGQRRAQALRAGKRLTEAHAEAVAALGPRARVLPMSDRPVRTWVLSDAGYRKLQDFLIVTKAQGEIADVQFRGAQLAGTTPEVLATVATADAIVIGPSNPVISIGPMLAIPELAQALKSSSAPVVAISPIVGGEVLKGPTAAFMRQRGVAVNAAGLAELYGDLLDGIVADQEVPGLPTLQTDLLMDGKAGRTRLAAETLRFALSL
jgi:LPPG:FO 2-phospho-L-lactate transferase